MKTAPQCGIIEKNERSLIMETISTRERLILSGMEEIRAYGLQGFSLRRVAKNCGISCAAPYKHFADKDALFAAMVDYIKVKWHESIDLGNSMKHGVENAIARLACSHIGFLCRNPHFKSVLLIKETGLDTPSAAEPIGISITAMRLFVIYGRKHALLRDELRGRIFTVRSLIYGAAIMLGSEEDFAAMEERLYASLLSALK